MPCRDWSEEPLIGHGGYYAETEPTAQDRKNERLFEAGKLQEWALNKLGRPIPDYIKRPTKGGKANEELVTGLCALIKSLNDEELNLVVYNGRDKNSRKLADWWDEHKEMDRKRELEEEHQRELAKYEAERKAKKRKVLAKLTAEEITLLELDKLANELGVNR